MGLLNLFKDKENKDDMKNSNLFIFDDSQNRYSVTLNSIRFICESVEDGYEAYAQKLAEIYDEKLPDIVAFIMPDVKAMFGDISKEDLMQSLGKPLIDLDMGTLTYLEHTLDELHIIEIEFDGDFEEFFYVTIDG